MTQKGAETALELSAVMIGLGVWFVNGSLTNMYIFAGTFTVVIAIVFIIDRWRK